MYRGAHNTIDRKESPQLIAVTGGIGSGKSVVTRMLAAMGYPTYDCDSRAKALMNDSDEIKRRICEVIHPEAVTVDGAINRPLIASIVFNDIPKLNALNSIVHEAVRCDIEQWRDRHRDAKALFVETAILYQSRLDKMVHKVINVYADESIRIERVCRRNALTPEEVINRIRSQQFNPDVPHRHITIIDNCGDKALLPQLLNFLNINNLQ